MKIISFVSGTPSLSPGLQVFEVIEMICSYYFKAVANPYLIPVKHKQRLKFILKSIKLVGKLNEAED